MNQATQKNILSGGWSVGSKCKEEGGNEKLDSWAKGFLRTMQSIKDIKAAILAEIDAEKKLQKPEIVDEPFLKADEAFRELAEFDVTKESIGTTVGGMRTFLHQLFEVLTTEMLETMKKADEENKETEKKRQEREALPEFMRKDEEFVFVDPLEIMKKELNSIYEKAEDDMTEKLTQFLDDRIHADRNSLVREKKRPQNNSMLPER